MWLCAKFGIFAECAYYENARQYISTEQMDKLNIFEKAAVVALKGIMRFFALFPLKVHYFWADVLAWLLGKCVRYRRDVVMINLSRSFPEKRYGEISRLADEFYVHLAEVFVETIWFAGATPARLRKSGIVTVANPEVIGEAFAKSKSVEVLYSHCGNWELLGGVESYFRISLPEGEHLSITDDELRIVYKKLTSRVWDHFIKENRAKPTRDYQGMVETGQLLRYMVKNRDKKLIYVLNVDQSPYAGAGAYDIGAFMNQPTQAMFGPAGLAHKMGLSVYYMRFDRLARGHYELSFIPVCEDASQMNPALIVRKYYDLLEQEIRDCPANWLWTHRRWKQKTDVMVADLDAYMNKGKAKAEN